MEVAHCPQTAAYLASGAEHGMEVKQDEEAAGVMQTVVAMGIMSTLKCGPFRRILGLKLTSEFRSLLFFNV